MQRWLVPLALALASLLLAAAAAAEQQVSNEADRASPRLVIGRPSIKGAMPRELYLRVLRRHRASLERCFAREPSPTVTLTMQIVIGPTGRVVRAAVAGGNARRQTTRACVIAAFEALDFGSHPAGVDIITQPLIYRDPDREASGP